MTRWFSTLLLLSSAGAELDAAEREGAGAARSEREDGAGRTAFSRLCSRKSRGTGKVPIVFFFLLLFIIGGHQVADLVPFKTALNLTRLVQDEHEIPTNSNGKHPKKIRVAWVQVDRDQPILNSSVLRDRLAPL